VYSLEGIIISIAERKERDKAAMREEILNAARKIVGSSGVDGISIRKIADMIEYSPASIYHYFKNKEEIVEILIGENYKKILETLSLSDFSEITPEEKLKEGSKRFIQLAVQMGDAYKSVMLSDSETVLSHTSVLQRGAAKERPAIGMLCDTLRKLPGYQQKANNQIEMAAQLIWSLTFGLALRLIIEQVEEEQQQQLIDNAAEFIFSAIKNITN